MDGANGPERSRAIDLVKYSYVMNAIEDAIYDMQVDRIVDARSSIVQVTGTGCSRCFDVVACYAACWLPVAEEGLFVLVSSSGHR